MLASLWFLLLHEQKVGREAGPLNPLPPMSPVSPCHPASPTPYHPAPMDGAPLSLFDLLCLLLTPLLPQGLADEEAALEDEVGREAGPLNPLPPMSSVSPCHPASPTPYHPVTLPPPFSFSLTFFPPCHHSHKTEPHVEKKKKTKRQMKKKKRGRAEEDVSCGYGCNP